MMVLSKLRTWGHGESLEDNNNTIKRDILRDSQSALSAHSRCMYNFIVLLLDCKSLFLGKKVNFFTAQNFEES